MKLKILSSAVEDLYEGYHFYERQRTGLGDYFFDSLFSDIDSLLIYAGIHPILLGTTGFFPSAFPTRFTTSWTLTSLSYDEFSTCGETQTTRAVRSNKHRQTFRKYAS